MGLTNSGFLELCAIRQKFNSGQALALCLEDPSLLGLPCTRLVSEDVLKHIANSFQLLAGNAFKSVLLISDGCYRLGETRNQSLDEDENGD